MLKPRFDKSTVLTPYVEKYKLEVYNEGSLKEPDLDEYFLHHRAIRESGHDTSYHPKGTYANLTTIDLNSLLYKYEDDTSRTIRTCFNGKLRIPPEFCTPGSVEMEPSVWGRRARRWKLAMYMWDDLFRRKKGMYFDYDTVKQKRRTYESATIFFARLAGFVLGRPCVRNQMY